MEKEEPAKALHVKIADQDGSQWTFRVKANTQMSKVFNEYSKRKHSMASNSKLRFCFNGRSVLPTDTPEVLGMEDNDQLEVFSAQVGGAPQ